MLEKRARAADKEEEAPLGEDVEVEDGRGGLRA